MKTEKIVDELVKMVIKNNIHNYQSYCTECDLDGSAKDFSKFGVDYDTVYDNLKGIMNQVTDKLEAEQKRIAGYVFN